MWRILELEVSEILIKGAVFLITASTVIPIILFVVGETMEHFTP